jgi:hypothetical protein
MLILHLFPPFLCSHPPFFVGTIPASIGGLRRLRRLDLSGNKLTGAIPGRVTQLTALTELLLQGNHLTGCLPDTLGNLINLTSLQLQDNNFQGSVPMSITRLVKLTGINLQNNPEFIGTFECVHCVVNADLFLFIFLFWCY